MCRDVEAKELDELAVERAYERSRQSGLRAVGAQVTGWRERSRAKTFLLLEQPLLSRESAKLQHLNIEIVRVNWHRWARQGMDALFDKPCNSAPHKLDAAAVERLLQSAREAALSATKLLQRHIEAQGLAVEVNILIDAPRGKRLNEVIKPLVIVLDNALIHDAAAIRAALALLEKGGVQFEFLSPYRTELNRIETLWRLMKHRWLAVKHRTKAELERAINHVFAHFGSQFKMAF